MVRLTLVRRHLVAVVAVVLALATGIALGAGPLSRQALFPARVATAPPVADHDEGDELAHDLAVAVGPALTRERLTGRSVAVVSTPGADDAIVEELVTGIEQAGGSTTGRWQVGRSLVAAGETALVDTLGEQLVEQVGDDVADPEAPTYERMGQLLGAAVATRGERAAVPQEQATTVRQSIDAASLLSTETENPRLAPLVLVVLGDDVEEATLEGLATGLAARARRVVVVAAERAGDLAAVESTGAATTVDGAGTPTGRLAALLALAEPTDEAPGSYGASGSDGVLPLG